MTYRLEEPILEDGVRFVNFFEGRILTGRDLTDEQAADRAQRLRLGRALGAGVISGLEVTRDAAPDGSAATRGGAGGGSGGAAAPVVSVAPGLAVTAEGEALELRASRTVALARAAEAADAVSDDLFGPCAGQAPGSTLPAGVGLYLLTLGPASGFQEEAPMAGIGTAEAGVGTGCGKRYATRGVAFRLIRVDQALAAGGGALAAEIAALMTRTDLPGRSRLRNLAANALHGTGARDGFARDPFAALAGGGGSSWAARGLLDALRAGDAPLLAPCEVPLALIHWTLAGIGFVDAPAARLRPGADPLAQPWPLVHAARAEAQSEALRAQFQAQHAWLTDALPADAFQSALRDYRFLPATGLVPSFGADSFFQGIPTEGPTTIPAARMLAVLEAGRACPAIDLMADPRPAIRLIRVEGTEGWYLFADARLPLAEAQAERIAALEAAVSALQEALAAPATVRGVARYRPNYLAALIDAPIGGLTLLALDAAGNEAGRTVTEQNGAYEMKLPPGVYRLTTLSGPNSPQHFGVVLEPGDQRRLDFIFLQPPQDIQ